MLPIDLSVIRDALVSYKNRFALNSVDKSNSASRSTWEKGHEKVAVEQCEICARWTDDGAYVPRRCGFPAGGHWVCGHCEREAAANSFVSLTLERFAVIGPAAGFRLVVGVTWLGVAVVWKVFASIGGGTFSHEDKHQDSWANTPVGGRTPDGGTIISHDRD